MSHTFQKVLRKRALDRHRYCCVARVPHGRRPRTSAVYNQYIHEVLACRYIFIKVGRWLDAHPTLPLTYDHVMVSEATFIQSR